jgi:class 3 adenylate cyclase
MEAPPLERKLVAILAADIQGYSRLMGIDEENTLATLSAHRAITDAIIAQHGGRICGTAGDSGRSAVRCVFLRLRS